MRIEADNIAAVSTPTGVGGIAMIRVSGPQAIDIVDSAWKGKSLKQATSHTAHLGKYFSTSGDMLDECVATVFRSPNTFTGEDVVEISVHGSAWLQREILADLIRRGARTAEPGEFTRRAFLNGRLDLAQAEGIADLISASSRAAHAMAITQTRGRFSKELDNLRDQLIEFASLLELELDFSEEDVEFADRSRLLTLSNKILDRIDRLTASYSAGSVLKEGVPVAIAGIPNAGKSSLLNLLLNEEKAIVTDIPGTTRDTIEDTIEIDGILYRFIDTAGLRESTDVVETIGIERARAAISRARIVIWLLDPTSPLPPQLSHLTSTLHPQLSSTLHPQLSSNPHPQLSSNPHPQLSSTPHPSSSLTTALSANGPTSVPHTPTEAPTSVPHNPTEAPTSVPHNPTEAPTSAPQTTTDAPTSVPQTTTQAPTSVPQTTTEAHTSDPHTPTEAHTSVPQTTTQAPTSVPQTTTQAPTSVPQTTTQAPTSVPHNPTEAQPSVHQTTIPGHSNWINKNVIILLNKSDLINPDNSSISDQHIPNEEIMHSIGHTVEWIPFSTKTGEGLKELTEKIVKLSTNGYNPNNELMVTNARHYEALLRGKASLERAIAALNTGLSADFIAQDVREALHHLGTITGAITSTTLLHSIFSRFCIGK